ncbi:uncharacterized protein VP01_5006g1 [Puccinia sorghi]|uniref:Retrotransposon gag domain-containing protein n=1 Tax=Puccinia sorghi TaxID=27349 RepID=A0A0L6ULN9_9BASI|nr:uncharacterized protein VP01_5006g1 [Puccinia sorghi]
MVLAKPQPFKGTRGAAAKSFPYLMRVFNAEEVAFNKFLEDFKSSFFDHDCQHCVEVFLRSLRQTGKVSAYMQDFNSHARTIGWAEAPLISLYQHGLKENIQLAMVMSNIQFLWTIQVMALKAGQPIEGFRNG